jgi:hypothetical protein
MSDFLVIKDSDIVEIPVTKEMLAQAKEKARNMGCLNSHSMMKGERNVEGALGELAVLAFLPQSTYVDNYDYDLRIGKLTIDVKTKRLNNRPKLGFDCSIYGYNPNQECHIYLFAGVKADHSVVWLSGFLAKHIFYQKAKFYPAGSERPLGMNKVLVYKEDNYVVQVKHLNKVDILKTIVPKR